MLVFPAQQQPSVPSDEACVLGRVDPCGRDSKGVGARGISCEVGEGHGGYGFVYPVRPCPLSEEVKNPLFVGMFT